MMRCCLGANELACDCEKREKRNRVIRTWLLVNAKNNSMVEKDEKRGLVTVDRAPVLTL